MSSYFKAAKQAAADASKRVNRFDFIQDLRFEQITGNTGGSSTEGGCFSIRVTSSLPFPS